MALAAKLFPNDHFEDGFSGALIRVFAHKSGRLFVANRVTIFWSSAFALSLQDSWVVTAGSDELFTALRIS